MERLDRNRSVDLRRPRIDRVRQAPYLPTGVVDIELAKHVVPRPFEEPGDRVADDRPPSMADVHRPGRVGAHELDHGLAPARGIGVAESLLLAPHRAELAEEEPPRDAQVEEPRSGDLHLRKGAVRIFDALDDRLRKRPGIGLGGTDRLGMLLLQRHRRIAGEVPVVGIFRRVELHRRSLRRQEPIPRAPVEGTLENLRDLALHHEDTGSPCRYSASNSGRSFAYVASRCSIITFVSASTGMKLVSPTHRGTTCQWM